MRAYDIILKKREGQELSSEEIRFMVNGYVQEKVADYQMSALAMAVFFRGMTSREISDLTLAMVESGDKVDLSPIPGIKVDKHSTGGVGDKTTLVLAPMVAAAGVPVAKMSGRGLGHTGGTLDKLESIAGFNVTLDRDAFLEQVRRTGIAVVGQSGNLVPADKKLYALRDVTATVDSIPLIASSVMSKKIAAGADAMVIDVKIGSGAFMRSVEEAFQLAETIVAIGTQVGRKTVAVVTGMEQPLGNAIGNALEVAEAVATLKGQGPRDLEELCLVLGSHMLVLGQKAADDEEARSILERILREGKALAKFKEFVEAQGGDGEITQNPGKLPQASLPVPVAAPADGYIAAIATDALGRAAAVLGAGRERKEEAIDPAVGIIVHKKLGDKVSAGEPMATIHANDRSKIDESRAIYLSAVQITAEKPRENPLIYGVVTEEGIEKIGF